MKRFGVEYLMEDGAPAHTKKSILHRKKNKIKVFLKKSPPKEGEFFWPGNSPDLNVIENAWSMWHFITKNTTKRQRFLENCPKKTMET